ncbi:MAG TPA: hypothetical protein VFX29_00825 [Longimicrobiaceae bacterium]|nr:hypothetical protein [Longimicrobiaceae bacterium]
MDDQERGTGFTEEQMRTAPKGAAFVWNNHDLQYPKQLAEYLGRTDLRIVRPNWLEHVAGKSVPAIVVDHAAELTPDQRAGWQWLNDRAELLREAAGIGA